MTLSTCDIGNPIYNKVKNPSFHSRCYTETDFRDDRDDEFTMTISFDYYIFDGVKRVVKCMYDPKPTYYMTDESMQESVKESILVNEGFVIFECTPERFEPKYKTQK